MVKQDVSLMQTVLLLVSEPSFFRSVDAGETELTRPIRSTMEFGGKVWRSLIVLKWNECKGMEGNAPRKGWMVDVDERTISRWLYEGLLVLIVPFEIVYTVPISTRE